jgi:hypothetical protein
VNRDEIMRRALRITTYFNVAGASLFAFPDSVGRLAGLPGPVPHLYSWFIAFLVLLFAATYAWLARQPVIDRALVLFSAVGKSGFFVVVSLCWWLGELPLLTVFGAAGDLAFAAVFFWWLLASSR